MNRTKDPKYPPNTFRCTPEQMPDRIKDVIELAYQFTAIFDPRTNYWIITYPTGPRNG